MEVGTVLPYHKELVWPWCRTAKRPDTYRAPIDVISHLVERAYGNGDVGPAVCRDRNIRIYEPAPVRNSSKTCATACSGSRDPTWLDPKLFVIVTSAKAHGGINMRSTCETVTRNLLVHDPEAYCLPASQKPRRGQNGGVSKGERTARKKHGFVRDAKSIRNRKDALWQSNIEHLIVVDCGVCRKDNNRGR